MKSQELFNELNGSKVTREEIGEIIEIAKTENNTSVIYRLFKILNENPYKTYFEIESLKEYPKALNGVQHQGIYKVALDNCGRLMPGFKYENGLVVRTTTGDKYFKPKTQKKSKTIAEKTTETKKNTVKPTVSKDKKSTKVAEVKKETPVLVKEKKTDQAKTKATVTPGGNKVSKSQSNKIGFMLLDSISGEMVASKKTLPLLKDVFDSLVEKEYFSDTEIFVYEIVNRNGKNVQGKRVAVDWKKKAVDKKGQIALFGAVEPKIIEVPEQKKAFHTNSNIQKIGSQNNEASEFFTVDGEVGKFLQQVEKKPFGSVVITIDGQQGAGKTTMLYQFMQSFADTENKCLFISGEEDPKSHLAKSKVEKYLTDQARQNIDTVGEVADVKELYSYIEPYDIIFIDSWQKLQRMVGNIRLDEDLRKKFHGKVFVIIFQQTTTGRTKGGAEVVFDGDIIIKMVKESSFELNYAFFDKNRYTLVPIETIRYNIAKAKCYNPEEPAETEITELSFTYKEN